MLSLVRVLPVAVTVIVTVINTRTDAFCSYIVNEECVCSLKKSKYSSLSFFLSLFSFSTSLSLYLFHLPFFVVQDGSA